MKKRRIHFRNIGMHNNISIGRYCTRKEIYAGEKKLLGGGKKNPVLAHPAQWVLHTLKSGRKWDFIYPIPELELFSQGSATVTPRALTLH